MNAILVVLLIVFVVVLYFKFTKSSNKPKKSQKTVHGKYHCVTVHSSVNACDAVKALAGKRILSSEAPVLPLSACDVDNCKCRFQHHEERRVDERRDAYHKTFDEISENTITMMPRSKTDRRKDN